MSQTILQSSNSNIPQKTEEITEIIERMPNRFGISITWIALVLVLALAFFGAVIRYPDILRGQITISTRQAPVKLISNSTGVLQLFYQKPGEMVKEGEYIAVIKNPATTSDVRLIDSQLNRFEIHNVSYGQHRRYFSESVILGELSSKYFDFLNALYQYLDYHRELPFNIQKKMLQNFSASQKQTLQEANDDYGRLKTKYQLALSMYKKDSVLFSERLISETDFEKSRISLISVEEEYRTRNKDIIAGQYQLSDATGKTRLLTTQRIEKERELEILLNNAYYDLLENIKQWEHKYVFKSPISGKIEFLNFLKSNDYVQQGQELFAILPQKNEMVGQVLLPSQGAGKVQPGQKVIIKLDNYPYTQYGSIKGEVLSISQLTNEQLLRENRINTYLVTINLPMGLTTNYGSSLNYDFEIKGVAEIVTDDRRLYERFFSNLKHRMSN